MRGKSAVATTAALLLLLADLLSLFLFSSYNNNGQHTAASSSSSSGGSSSSISNIGLGCSTSMLQPSSNATGAGSFIANDGTYRNCQEEQEEEHESIYHRQYLIQIEPNEGKQIQYGGHSFVLLADAKGVAGLGKAGGDGTGGSDKAGQQVPPEVYNALTYAGTAFLFTLSVPLILYGLNKLLNKIEDCFGCGPSSKKARRLELQQQQQQLKNQQLQQELEPSKLQSQLSNAINNKSPLSHHHQLQQPLKQDSVASMTLPFDNSELNYNKTNSSTTATTMANNGNTMQQNFQQPYIISGPQI